MAQSQELKRYLYLFLRWWWLIVLCALLGAGAAYAYSSRQTPVYTATATLRVQFGGAGDELRGLYYGEQLASAHSQMLTGRTVMRAVIDRLSLEMTPEDLAGLIKIQQVPEAALIRLSVTYIDPVQAAQIVNAVAEAYVAHNETVQQSRYADYLNGVQHQMAEMAALIESTSVAISALGTPITDQEHAELARLETTLAGYRTTHAMLWNNYEEMRLTAALSTDSVALFEPAEAPRAPDGASSTRNTALAGAVGAMLAAGIAFLIDYLDETIKTPDDVRETLGLNTLGVIGRMRKGDTERIVAEHPRSPISEGYRRLRTNVRFTSLDRPLRTLLVTSPGVSEGKSVTVANLATAMAQSGLRVAIVDADLRRPRQHTMFPVGASEGLTQSLLEGRMNGHMAPVEDTEGLAVLPSGELPPNPAELLGSRRMQVLLEQLAAEVDVVLVDSPPILPVTDAVVLAQSVDGVLLVIDAERTRRSAAQQAVESLRQVEANVLGVVLNGVPQRRGGYHYYYHYYSDGDGRRKEKTKTRETKWRLRAVDRPAAHSRPEPGPAAPQQAPRVHREHPATARPAPVKAEPAVPAAAEPAAAKAAGAEAAGALHAADDPRRTQPMRLIEPSPDRPPPDRAEVGLNDEPQGRRAGAGSGDAAQNDTRDDRPDPNSEWTRYVRSWTRPAASSRDQEDKE